MYMCNYLGSIYISMLYTLRYAEYGVHSHQLFSSKNHVSCAVFLHALLWLCMHVASYNIYIKGGACMHSLVAKQLE